ncbi:MAG: dihydrofolate reductase, partial [Bacteroides sp.]|nr:dihydrofolate reductase [Bacteroides sp.]
DAVLLSYTSRINRYVLECCPNVKYIGMCCSLYSPESANVDIRYANERGITVTGIRDYGDEGVVEYVVSELVRCLHGFGQESWEELPREITGLKVGIVGLGKSGGMIADALKFFGADISYYARSEKEAATAKGYCFLPLEKLLAAEWLEGDNLCFCDTIGALGSEQLLNHPHVRCMQVSTGRTRQAFDRLSAKVLANLSEYNG